MGQSGDSGHFLTRVTPTEVESAPLCAGEIDLNGPNITFSNPAANNSYINKPASGLFRFLIDLEPVCEGNDSHGHLVEAFKPNITLDGVARDFECVSGGDLTSWYYNWDIGGHAHQDNIVAIVNASNNNTMNSVLWNFTIDLTSPNVNVLNPLQDGNISTNTMVRIQCADGLSGIDTVTFNIFYLLPPYTPYYGFAMTNEGDEWTYNWAVVTNSWSPGLYNLTFEVSDLAGNHLLREVTVLVDYAAPALDFYAPSDHSTIGGTIAFQVFARDYGTGVDNVTIQIKGDTPVCMAKTSQFVYSHSCNTRAFVDAEVIPVVVRSYDYSGLVNVSTASFTIDNTAPNATLEGNTNITKTASFNLTCNDAQGIAKVAWRIDNNTYRTLEALSSQVLSFSSRNYADGNHTLQVLVEDKAGNAFLLNKSIFIDNTPPQVAVRNLRDGQVIEATFVLQVYVYEALAQNLTLSYSLNNESWVVATELVAPNLWKIPLGALPTLRSGANNITIRGNNSAGGYDEDFYVFIFNKPPAFDFWWIAYGAGAVLVIWGIVVVAKKFRKTYRDYSQRVDQEVQRVKEQKAIEGAVAEEISKVDTSTEGGFFKKPPAPKGDE